MVRENHKVEGRSFQGALRKAATARFILKPAFRNIFLKRPG
jgi:hypothetical protein